MHSFRGIFLTILQYIKNVYLKIWNEVTSYPYGSVPYATGPEVVEVENSGGADSSDVLVVHMKGSEGHSLQGAEARTQRTHPGVGSACYMPLHTADKEFDGHYLQQNVSSGFTIFYYVLE